MSEEKQDPASEQPEAGETPAKKESTAETETPAKEESKAEAEAPAKEETKAEAEAPAKEETKPKAEAPAKKESKPKAEAPAKKESKPKAEAPAKKESKSKAEAPAKKESKVEASSNKQPEAEEKDDSEAEPEVGGKSSAAPTAAELLADDLGDAKVIKAKKSKNVTHGIVHIRATFNNTLVTITDMQGNPISWFSAGRAGFKGSRKSTSYAATQVAQRAARDAMAHGLKEVEVRIKGPGSGRESAIRGLQAVGLDITTIKDVTPVPHNGCRPKKRRRV